MRQRKVVESVLSKLRMELDGWPRPTATTRLSFTPPSVLTEGTYAGHRLRDLVVPSTRFSLLEMAKSFDKFIVEGNHELKLSPLEKYYLDNNVVNLLVWASALPGVDLDYSVEEGRVMVLGEYSFGIADGKVYGLNVIKDFDGDIAKLTEPKRCHTRESGFAALYNHARRRKLTEALQALQVLRAYKLAPWRSMAPWTWSAGVTGVLSTLGEIIYTAEDPISELYIRLVPAHMDSASFTRRIGDPTNRSTDLDSEARYNLWKKLENIFKQ